MFEIDGVFDGIEAKKRGYVIWEEQGLKTVGDKGLAVWVHGIAIEVDCDEIRV